MLALGFKRKRKFTEPWSFHIQMCKPTLANTQGPLSVLLLALGVDQGKPIPCFKAEVQAARPMQNEKDSGRTTYLPSFLPR